MVYYRSVCIPQDFSSTFAQSLARIAIHFGDLAIFHFLNTWLSVSSEAAREQFS